jgi:hypothetical protein
MVTASLWNSSFDMTLWMWWQRHFPKHHHDWTMTWFTVALDDEVDSESEDVLMKDERRGGMALNDPSVDSDCIS